MELLTKYRLIKPNFSDSFSHGWEVMKTYFLHLFLVVIVLGIIDGPVKFISDDGHMSGLEALLAIIALAYYLLFVPIIKWGGKLMFLQAVRNERPAMETLMIGFKNYLNIILAHLLRAAIIGLGCVALLIPGIIFACRLAFVPYLVMDKNLDPITAVEESWRLTRGYGWTIFVMAIASFFIAILGLALMLVGIIPAAIWIGASFASIYQAALNEKGLHGNVEPTSEPVTPNYQI